MIENLITLALLILLQAVLGFDNLLYITLESKRAPTDKQKSVRIMGITVAMVLRIGLLFLLTRLVKYVQDPILHFDWKGVIHANMNIHSMIVLFGGAFILYTAVKEIWHMMHLDEDSHHDNSKKSTNKIIAMIVFMNLIFSFDSILSAMALTDVFWIMAVAIVISGILMIWLADHVAVFLQKNRMYEVLGLFVLFVVGIMLLTEGGHLAHLNLFGNEITPMNTTTFYFIIAILVIVDIVQGKYQKNLLKLKEKKNK